MTLQLAPTNQKSTVSAAVHEHAWELESAHNTSQGRVLYLVCLTGCGARRIELAGGDPAIREELHTTSVGP